MRAHTGSCVMPLVRVRYLGRGSQHWQPWQEKLENPSYELELDSVTVSARLLTIVDNMSRESPAIEVDRLLTGQRVVAVLSRVAAHTGLPKVIQVDNGPEFTSQALDAWAHHHGVKLAFSRPGTPTDNPFIIPSSKRSTGGTVRSASISNDFTRWTKPETA